MFYYYFDRYYWILIVPAMLFAMWAQTKVNSTYNRYNRVYSAKRLVPYPCGARFGQADRPL